MVYDVIKDLPPLCAWILFPSGVNPWSADDWHTFGFNDVLASITAIPSWIVHTGWAGVGVDKEKWFVGGHSNGGQGTWFTLLHHPDKVFAASPLSGYLSIQSYVPYTLWRPTIAPKKRAVLDATGASFHAGLLASNAKGIPVLIQHGGEDDNVPVYHSRLMTQLLGEAGVESTFVEVPGQGHWWDGVVTTDVLVDFYKEQFGRAHVERNVPRRFKVIVANPVDHSGMYGVRVLYLLEYGELGRVVVEWDEEEMVWRFETENVMALKWNGEKLGSSVVVDGMKIGLGDPGMTHVWRDESGKWTVKVTARRTRSLY
jgi:predicted esterase